MHKWPRLCTPSHSDKIDAGQSALLMYVCTWCQKHEEVVLQLVQTGAMLMTEYTSVVFVYCLHEASLSLF
jgi:hypothetical protein